MFGNAKSYFITSKRTASLSQVLRDFFKTGNIPVERVIEAGGAWVGAQRIKDPAFTVSAGTTVKVYLSPTQHHQYVIVPADIVFENADFLAVMKPPGLSTVPDRACDQFNLTTAVSNYLFQNRIRYTTTAISRLDLMVSGLVLFPKHKTAERDLFELMQQHRIRKLYRASVTPKQQMPEFFRVRCLIGFQKKAWRDPNGKESLSFFLRKSKGNDHHEYSVIPVTGKRHQIRFHAALTVGPITGDTLYGGKKSPGDGLGLMAVGYRFCWKGKRVDIRYSGKMPLPIQGFPDGTIVGEGVTPIGLI
ncbi:RNA pseudouridine synthase [bacterium]|nr:RNA pseudouridine synthase [bacterium]